MAHNRNNDLVRSDEHYTPAWLFEALNLEFDIDVCAPEGGVSWIPAKSYFTESIDCLSQEWSGRVWMNPPFSKPAPFVEKFIEHGNGIALMVVSKSKWFQAIWNAADAITPTARNMKFERPDGSNKTISFQSFLFAMGKENAEALHKLKDYKVR
jgi:hypothetical protein